ncbi:MFS transporter [Thermostaphylospora chromogena]|uniref:Drug resistance transporter, EmrB/QacA subfamily n=1 Tax=Thermostaphylospora chromogena TaxID=35622 RepID=A0A1H1C339_9ACTN|nr:MFS transporter [Thermostaphylospora chromogena]SDQ58545.1 drug resistance transporter, EmrB/QacA subfamily [Thermostaphylospora chromogena]
MSEGAENPAARPGSEGPRPHPMILVLACLGQFMVVLDVSIVNVALPAIRTSLGFDTTGLQWVVNAYSLTFAGLMLLGGRICDLYGRKQVFIIGVTLFSLASLLGGMATTQSQLVAGRALQGIGAAVLAPATLTILTTTFTEGPGRTRAVASWSAVGAVGGAVGSLLGGVLTQTLSWRWILLINVPIGAVLVAAAVRYLVESRGPRDGGLDIPGTVLVTAGIALLALGTVQTEEYGWLAAQTLVPLAAGVAALAGFTAVEARWARNPLVPLGLLRSRAVVGGAAVMLAVGAVMVAMWYFLSLHMQENLRYTPIQTGMAFIPHTVALIAGARLATLLIPRTGNRLLIALGCLIGSTGFAWQSVMAPDFITGVLLPGVVICVGTSLTFTPATLITTGGAGPHLAGLLSGMLNTSRQVGGSLGLAALATVAAGAAVPGEGYGRAFVIGAAILALTSAATPLLPHDRGPRGR